jgi:hypothetical protein
VQALFEGGEKVEPGRDIGLQPDRVGEALGFDPAGRRVGRGLGRRGQLFENPAPLAAGALLRR